jgi:hypothetical protein
MLASVMADSSTSAQRRDGERRATLNLPVVRVPRRTKEKDPLHNIARIFCGKVSNHILMPTDLLDEKQARMKCFLDGGSISYQMIK